MPGPTHYQRLGVGESSSLDEIRSAYRTVARVNHPDAMGSAAGSDMAAVNEAWRVLSDPGRRALYDRSLRGPPPEPQVAEVRRDETDVAEARQPVAGGRGGRFPIWPFVMLFVLAAIFIFTAGALSSDPQPLGPDNLLFQGSCVIVEPNGDAREVSCAGPHDGVVVTVVNFDQSCPSNTRSQRDRQGRGWACLQDG